MQAGSGRWRFRSMGRARLCCHRGEDGSRVELGPTIPMPKAMPKAMNAFVLLGMRLCGHTVASYVHST